MHKSLLGIYTPILPCRHGHLDRDMTSRDLPPVGPRSPTPSRVWALTMPSVIQAFKGVSDCVALNTNQPNHLVVYGSHSYLCNPGERTCAIHCPPKDDPATCCSGKTEVIRRKLPLAPTSPCAHLPVSGPVLCLSLLQGALLCASKTTPTARAPYCLLSCLQSSSSNSSCISCSNRFPSLLLALSHQHIIMLSFSQS